MRGSASTLPVACNRPRAVSSLRVVAALPMSIWPQAMLYWRPSSDSELVSPVSACLVDQHLSRAALERPVRDGRNPEGALFRLTGLGDIDPPDVRRAIPLAVDGLEHRLDPFFKALLRCLHRLAIHPGGRALWNL